jgi:hypothetical protein
MAQFRILALDGGGSWALIQVKALIELYGAQMRGRELLGQFDLAAANSGGSIVLGCLIEDLTLSEILAFFKDKQKRQSVFYKTSSHWSLALHRLLGVGPKYSAAKKLEALQATLLRQGRRSLSAAVAGIRAASGDGDLHALIVAFDYDVNRAVFFRSAAVSQPSWGEGSATEVALAEAVHASTNAPVNYFDGPAEFPGRFDRYWDGAVSGCNNPVLAAVSEAVGLGHAPQNIVALSLGTASLTLPPATPNGPVSHYVNARSQTGLLNDVGKLAGAILDDPPDAATFLAHLMTGSCKALPADAPQSRIVRMSPLIAPIASPPGAADPWSPPEGMTMAQFDALRQLDMDAIEEPQVALIERLAELWIANNVRNQPIRMQGKTLVCELGQPTFAEARQAWSALRNL